MQVPLIDLRAAYKAQQAALDAAAQRVLAGGWYVLGQEVARFEEVFAATCGRRYGVGVGSGTAALSLALKAYDIGRGDEVITVAHTAVATAAAIVLCGARPVFVDVDPLTYTLDPQRLAAALSARTKAIVPVHLYGQMAGMGPIMAFAAAHDLLVIEDCAQAHGAMLDGRAAGSFGSAAAFSFYPTKNLGAAGDGGAVLCDDQERAERLRRLRQYGWRERYISEEVGDNSRLDELQAALLSVKLGRLAQDNAARQRVAVLYGRLLAGTPLTLPRERTGVEHVYHLYVVQAPRRDALQAYLAEAGIGTAVHYPVPVHLQPAYTDCGFAAGSLPVSEALAGSILSLPMHPYLESEQIEYVAETIRRFYAG
ncbi:MAG: DegT/DnrJ/EryC1/StrS family aminotransferase [Candidatus Promineifilaceae bacterium]